MFSDPIEVNDARPLVRELQHVITAGALILAVSAAFLYVTVVAKVIVEPNAATGMSALARLGRQVAEDTGFLFPPLIAVQALLIGVPLAGLRTHSRTASTIARASAVASCFVASVGVVAIVLGSIAATRYPATADRLWSMTVLLIVLVLLALATGTLVFGPATEQLRQQQERLTVSSERLERLDTSILDGFTPLPSQTSQQDLLRTGISLTVATIALSLALAITLGHISPDRIASSLLACTLLTLWAVLWAGLIVYSRGTGTPKTALLLSAMFLLFLIPLTAAAWQEPPWLALVFATTQAFPLAAAWARPFRLHPSWNAWIPVASAQGIHHRWAQRQVKSGKADIGVLIRRIAENDSTRRPENVTERPWRPTHA